MAATIEMKRIEPAEVEENAPFDVTVMVQHDDAGPLTVTVALLSDEVRLQLVDLSKPDEAPSTSISVEPGDLTEHTFTCVLRRRFGVSHADDASNVGLFARVAGPHAPHTCDPLNVRFVGLEARHEPGPA